jgi:hypothetical protein
MLEALPLQSSCLVDTGEWCRFCKFIMYAACPPESGGNNFIEMSPLLHMLYIYRFLGMSVPPFWVVVFETLKKIPWIFCHLFQNMYILIFILGSILMYVMSSTIIVSATSWLWSLGVILFTVIIGVFSEINTSFVAVGFTYRCCWLWSLW